MIIEVGIVVILVWGQWLVKDKAGIPEVFDNVLDLGGGYTSVLTWKKLTEL